jgi:hypothetical protein
VRVCRRVALILELANELTRVRVVWTSLSPSRHERAPYWRDAVEQLRNGRKRRTRRTAREPVDRQTGRVAESVVVRLTTSCGLTLSRPLRRSRVACSRFDHRAFGTRLCVIGCANQRLQRQMIASDELVVAARRVVTNPGRQDCAIEPVTFVEFERAHAAMRTDLGIAVSRTVGAAPFGACAYGGTGACGHRGPAGGNEKRQCFSGPRVCHAGPRHRICGGESQQKAYRHAPHVSMPLIAPALGRPPYPQATATLDSAVVLLRSCAGASSALWRPGVVSGPLGLAEAVCATRISARAITT